MATVSFSPGDTFSFPDGFGVVLTEGKALIIKGQGGRTGYKTEKVNIPTGAVPAELPSKFEVRFALEAVSIAIK